MPVFSPAAATTLTIAGNEELEAEELESFEVGWLCDHRDRASGGDGGDIGRDAESIRAGVTAYYNRIDGLAEVDASLFPRVLPVNVGKEEAFGVEVDLD